MAIAYLSRRETFSASHRLHSSRLSDEENQEIFGKCNHPNGHGHNYTLWVVVRGEVDVDTGLVMNLTDLRQLVHDRVLAMVDHRHLNLDVPEFAHVNPTAENIAIVIWEWLKPALGSLLYEVKLQETENNVAIYRGER